MPQLRRDLLRSLEAGIVGLFLIQAVRYVYATLYAHVSSADLGQRISNFNADVPGAIEVTKAQQEVIALGAMLVLPLLAVIISRWRFSFPLAVILVAVGRSMALQVADLAVPMASLVIGAGLLYMALIIIRRPTYFPAMLLTGLAAEQIIRTLGDTVDHTWQGDYAINLSTLADQLFPPSVRESLPDRIALNMGGVVSVSAVLLILLSIVIWFVERQDARREARAEGYAPPLRGLLNVWGGLALGGIFYLEFTLLGLPNVIARWSETDYAGIVPWLLAATTLPLVPEVRGLARRFAGMFDGAWRGWLWMLLLGLLLVVGRGYGGILAAIALVLAQFLVGLTLWWLVQTGLPNRNFTGLTILSGVVAFLALLIGNYFTFDYAYVRDMQEPYNNLGSVLRSFRDMGLGLALVASLLTAIPMILARRRIPWKGGRAVYTLLILVLVLAVSFAGATIASSSIIRRPLSADCLRVATYNIHGGYSQFFDPNLENAARIIELSGADIVLLQEVETGRLASFGVDQVLWLSRRLQMEASFFPQNEALQGIAVLSRVPIVDMQGLLLPSEGNQAAAMHVVLDPERLVADPLAGDLNYLHVYNTWLGFRVAERNGQPVPEGEQDQSRQMDLMLNWIAGQHAPAWTDRILLGGTFNFGPDSPLYRLLRMDQLESPAILDPFAGLRNENVNTLYLVDGTAARFDYLWVFNVPIRGMLIDNSPEAANTSDHRPAIVAISRRQGEDIICQP